jgi:NTE family protein
MLKALTRHGIVADLLTGVSVGAINTVCYAADPTAQGVERLESIWRQLTRHNVFPTPKLRSWFGIASGRGYLVEPTALTALLGSSLPVQSFAQLRRPCVVVATDVLGGTAVELSRGALVPALLATAAIPGIFPPVRIDDRLLIDGGVAYQAPFAAALERGATRIYVLPTGYSCARREPPSGAIGLALHALNMLTVAKLIGSIHFYESRVELRVVPPLCPIGVSPLDFGHTRELIDRAEEQTDAWIRSDEFGGGQVPHQLEPHSHAA